MPYQANAYNVMIASPGDVARERVVARDVVLEWNAINSEDRQIVLLPIGWDTHSTPSMADTAQAVINSQVLERCDLLIAIFWTRLGTPTGEFASGTVEEIERHLASGKAAMIYFSNAPVVPDSIDQEQYAALVEFRESLKNRGLVSFYDDASAFRTDLFRHLSQTVIREFTGDQNGGVNPIAIPIPVERNELEISGAARELLFAAVGDAGGRIMNVRYLGGMEISTGGRNFIDDASPRTAAKWEGALDELENCGLIVARGTKREVFSVTEQGYAFAESLGVTPAP
ncbi:hypothetical protein [Rosistilla oblonga]|uniref:DUF4062 domain-containing protein n=1 Tax=Rosistilla oblonga TaxID=2527990 RepID=A0A518IUK9_9BACT|nr:hypothetical protein [Rosistilla oblonga]QDV56773.1 hypothetical protein Mal33_27720 [Rosistilla oblonga]